MKIPTILLKKINRHTEYKAILYKAELEIESWLQPSKTPFFLEYTDHGLNHLEDVLTTSVELMTKKAQAKISAHDALILILAVFLHDSAMHLTEDSFKALIKRESRWRPIGFFDYQTWEQLWTNFLSAARRFDERKLYALFGDAEPIQTPDKNPLKWTIRDQLLIGEFIRRNHPRLAHEIALHGIPAADGETITLIDTSSYQATADLAGLVARSHGHSLRISIEYLNTNYNISEYQKAHPVYLMVLLRIADHLQIHPRRAAIKSLKFKKIHSPFSETEWNVHNSIENITRAGEKDPEAILLDARPEGIKTFLKVKEWMESLQFELDTSWAVLGEVYGRNADLKVLNINLRRLKSNIDNLQLDCQKFDYVPEKICFDTANSELLKLLIAPLYGGDPAIGVRELLQNSVDAVREIEQFIKQRPKLETLQRRDHGCHNTDVLITLEADANGRIKYLTISDRGIGMNLEVLRDYFLKAGASFRNSTAWKQLYEDQNRNSSVMRSGRFGVGALAAFLIGDEITVTTRHVESGEDNGLTFTTKLYEEAIEIRKTKALVGTEIKVSVPRSMRVRFPELLKNQYMMSKPSYKAICSDHSDGKNLEKSGLLPSEGEEFVFPWRHTKGDKFPHIHWVYDTDFLNKKILRSDSAAAFCNGMFISKSDNNPKLVRESRIILKKPTVSFFDPNGLLPLTLQRDKIIDEDKIHKNEVLNSMIKDLIAYALVCAPEKLSSPSDFKWLEGDFEGNSRAYNVYSYGTHVCIGPLWAISSKGFTLNHDHLISHLSCEKIFVLFFEGVLNDTGIDQKFLKELGENEWLVTCTYGSNKINSFKHCLNLIFNKKPTNKISNYQFAYEQFYSAVYKPIEEAVKNHKSTGKTLKKAILGADAIYQSDQWSIFSHKGSPSSNDSLKFLKYLAGQSKIDGIFAITELSNIKELTNPKKNNLISDLWLEILDEDPVIPWKIAERENKFSPHVYESLAPYINHWKHALKH